MCCLHCCRLQGIAEPQHDVTRALVRVYRQNASFFASRFLREGEALWSALPRDARTAAKWSWQVLKIALSLRQPG
jgi:hypothetical protein